jgi:hypothetical protein
MPGGGTCEASCPAGGGALRRAISHTITPITAKQTRSTKMLRATKLALALALLALGVAIGAGCGVAVA